jgi:hypothetical protein
VEFTKLPPVSHFWGSFRELTLDAGELSRIDREEGFKSKYDQLGSIKIEA